MIIPMQEFDNFENMYNQYEEHEYHVLNIKIFDWGTFQRGLNYYSTLYNPQTKEAIFTLFVGIARLCWLGKKGNKVSFANIYAKSSFFIVLSDSKFRNDYKKKVSQWTEHWTQKCTDLNWHENRELKFNKKPIAISLMLELVLKTQKVSTLKI